MTWATQIDVIMSAAAANAAGVVDIGFITLNSLIERDINNPITINDLKRSVVKRIDVKKTARFSLSAAIVNHSIVNALDKKLDTLANAESQDFGNEVVCFAIIQKPYVALTSGDNVRFIIDVQVNANYIYNPKLWDSFSMSLGEKEGQPRVELTSKNHSNSIFVLEGFPVMRMGSQRMYNPLLNANTSLPYDWRAAAAKVKEFYTAHRSWIDPMVTAGMRYGSRFLVKNPTVQDDGQEDGQLYLDVPHVVTALQSALKFLD